MLSHSFWSFFIFASIVITFFRDCSDRSDLYFFIIWFLVVDNEAIVSLDGFAIPLFIPQKKQQLKLVPRLYYNMPITSIYHLSDIHIRAGNSERSREHEYLSVFDNLFKTLESINPEESVIVLTGDLFHNKHRLEPHGMRLAIKLFKGLASLARTYVIRGNHDYRQDAPGELDLIGAFNEYAIPNLFYMDEKGVFEVDNVGFGLVPIQETLLRNATSGIEAELPEFPEPDFSEAVDTTVALFHGSVIHAKLQNGQTIDREGYPLEWFKGYDKILLGDIHLQQVNKTLKQWPALKHTETSTQLTTYQCKKGTWAYPGSLLQQDFGEALLGHGLLHWDLEADTVTEHHIHNPYGYVTARLVDDRLEITMRKDGKGVWVGIGEVVGLAWFPSKLFVRVSTSGSSTATTLQTVVRLFQEAGREVLGISELNPLSSGAGSAGENVVVESDVDMMELNSPMMWEQFIMDNCKEPVVQESDVWRSWLQHPEEILIPVESLDLSLVGAVKERNDKLLKHVELFNDAVETHLRETGLFGKVSLKYLSWNWLFNYGPGNHYNFSDCEKKLVILNAKNGCGKSNFFEVICVALFGSGFPSRFNKNFSAAILNDKTPVDGTPSTILVFELNGKEYCIERVFHARTQKGQENLVKYTKIAISEYPSGLVVCQNKVAVDNWLESHMGTLATFLSSCMLTQDGDCNFFSLEKAAQKRLIDDVFSLKAVQTLQGLLEEGKKAYKGILKDIDLWLAAKHVEGSTEDAVSLQRELTALDAHLLELRASIQEAHKGWSAYPSRDFSERDLASYQSELEGLEESIDGVVADLQTERQVLREQINRLQGTLNGKTVKSSKAVKPKGTLAEVQSRLERFQREQKALLRSWEHRTDEEDADHILDTITQQEYEALVAERKGWAEGWRRRGVTEGTVAAVVGVSVTQLTEDLGLAEAEQIRILEDKPNAPSKTVVGTVEDLKKQLVETGPDYSSKIPILESIAAAYPGYTEKWARLSTDIKELKQQIKEYEAMPFNPECASCKAQPWKRREQEDKAKLAKFQEERKQLQTRLAELADSYGDLDDVTGALTEIKRRVREQEDLGIAIAFRTWQNGATAIADRVKQLRFQKEQAVLSELVTQFKAEQAVWDEKVLVGGRMWATGVKAGLALALAEAEAWEAWTVAEASQGLRLAEKRLLVVESACRRAELEGLVAAYPCWQQETALRAEEILAVTKGSELRLRVAQSAVRNGSVAVAVAKKKIEVRQTLVEVLAEAFKSYRQWLYKDKLRPLIQNAVNGLLVNICDGRPLFLEAEWLDAIDTFAWFLRDGSSRPIIEKASGFQRFIVGMAMRIAMSRLGICKVVYDQLFIDEGFTACDGPNLEKTPAFLRALLGSYSSVLLATHLEELKSCGDHQVLIRRSDLSGIASIQAGALSQVGAIPPAKRGKRVPGPVPVHS